MRRIRTVGAALMAVGMASAGVAVEAASAAAPYCGQVWGSLPEAAGDFTSAEITNLRTGRHACFDRLVIDLGPPVAGLPSGPVGYDVHYGQVVEDGTGDVVPVAGAADLVIVVRANAYDLNGNPTYAPADRLHARDVTGYRTFRQVAFLGTFEGYTTIGLGVRARLPFRVQVLAGPGAGSRLVIDVGHRW
jgi:hypothetical protein